LNASNPDAGASPTPKGSRPWFSRAVIALGALVVMILMLPLLASYRYVSVQGADHLDGSRTRRLQFIAASWHERLFVCGWWFRGHMRRAGVGLVVLASLSRDGEYAAALARLARLRVVRGSTSRGGLLALWKLVREVRRESSSAFTAPDGPRGPARQAQAGTVVLSQSTGTPILPLAFAADRVWRLRSWDRLMLPKPFARIAVVAEEPLAVDADLTSAEIPAVCEELGRRLDRAVERAESALADASRS